jgi:putative endonuclease
VCHVYILCCVDGSFYVGWTQNLDDRVRTHNEGRGSTYTCKRRPVRLVYSEAFLSEVEAIQRERQLKRWSAAKKESLIMGDIQKLKRLSKPRS